jgi:iron complex outermembrane recepter protein
MLKNTLVSSASAAALVAALLCATPALAQNAAPVAAKPAPAAAATPSTDSGDIVVTAQRRSENLQNVPVAITVVSGASLAAKNINSVESLNQQVPSLTFKRGTANVNSTLAIRGLGTQSFASGTEPSVSTVIDGVVYGRSGMATQEFADIDRVEVLRGPQGTLFGKNASTGALNITTRAPSATPALEGSVSYFGSNEFRATGLVSGALATGLKAVVSGYYGSYDGNIKNVYNNSMVNGYTRYGVRGKFVYETGDVKMALNADYSHNNDNCCADVLGKFYPNAQGTNVFLPLQLPNVPGPNNRSVNNNFTPGTVDTNQGISYTFDWKFDGLTLTSITAYRDWQNRQLRDGDFGSVGQAYVAIGSPAAGQILDQQDNGYLDFSQYSEELRLSSPTGGNLEYVLGGFYWRTNENDNFTRSDVYCSASTLAIDVTGFRPCSTAPGVSTFTTASGPASWNTKFANEALYGQGTYKLSPKLKIIAGLRYTHDEVSYSFSRINLTNGAASFPGISVPYTYADNAAGNGLSGKTGLEFQPSRDFMAYAIYSRGYKGPALNVFYSLTANNIGGIAPETSNAYELGFKSKLLHRKLTFNADIYQQDVENFQASSFVQLANSATAVTLTNAGAVRSQGFEMDFTWRALTGLNINGGYTYNKATIRAFNCSPALSGSNLAFCLAHNGQTLPFAPRNKFNLNADWTLPLGNMPFKTSIGSTISYSSRINFDLDQMSRSANSSTIDPYLAQQAPYALVDANITFTSKNDKLKLALIGKNLGDTYYVSFITPANGTGVGTYARLQVPRDAERYFGARLSFKY